MNIRDQKLLRSIVQKIQKEYSSADALCAAQMIEAFGPERFGLDANEIAFCESRGIIEHTPDGWTALSRRGVLPLPVNIERRLTNLTQHEYDNNGWHIGFAYYAPDELGRLRWTGRSDEFRLTEGELFEALQLWATHIQVYRDKEARQ